MSAVSTGITFVGAENGGIELWAGPYKIISSASVTDLANAAVYFGGFAENCGGSSSCDFATEYGFATQADFDELMGDTFRMVTHLQLSQLNMAYNVAA